jgi:CheY-like chemotaxis protein
MMQERYILHVEDDMQYQMLCKKAFEKLGYTYTGVQTAEKAYEILTQEKTDLLLIDCFLRSEGINGDILMENLLADSKFNIPIIYVSNSPRPAYIKKLKKEHPSCLLIECPKQEFLPILSKLNPAEDIPPPLLLELIEKQAHPAVG